jgi:hypothetical protein
VIYADEAATWDDWHERFEIERSNQTAHGVHGARARMAEDWLARLRRARIGIPHPVAGSCLLRSAQDSSWHKDNRSISHDDQVKRIAGASVAA